MAPSALDRIFQSSATKPQAGPSKDYAAEFPADQIKDLPGGYRKLPNGVILDNDGKPCRSCTSSSAWMGMMRNANKPTQKSASSLATVGASTIAATSSSEDAQSECPPDVDELGRSTWSLLHSMAATYPSSANASMQSTMRQFISTFSQLYPCWVCAEDFRAWMKEPGNEPRLEGQEELGTWMCEAHNAVNVKLGKETFDCSLWKQRWKDGWKDGRCD